MTDMRFDGRVAVITGAGRGLGKEYALLLAARGARVVVNDLDDDEASAVARVITSLGGHAVADANNVATPDGGQAIVDAAVDAWGHIDILVNNAGIVGDSPFDDMTDERLSPLIDVHLKGTFFVTRPAWRVMRERGYGRIVNTCSAAGILGAERMSNYGAAKTGLLGLTRVLSAEGAGAGIKVNVIAPIAATRMLEQSMKSVAELSGPEALAAAEEVMRPFLERLDPALVAPVVAFLAHEDCPVSGEIFTVGAGHVAHFFIGRTKGYFNPALSPEDVRAHLGQIRDREDYTVPTGPADEMVELFTAIMAP